MRIRRRPFLADLGMGVTGMAPGAMMAEGAKGSEATQFTPRAKSVIWIFLSGGYSHMETFDPKPALNKYAGMTFDKTHRCIANGFVRCPRRRSMSGMFIQQSSRCRLIGENAARAALK